MLGCSLDKKYHLLAWNATAQNALCELVLKLKRPIHYLNYHLIKNFFESSFKRFKAESKFVLILLIVNSATILLHRPLTVHILKTILKPFPVEANYQRPFRRRSVVLLDEWQLPKAEAMVGKDLCEGLQCIRSNYY